MTRMGRAREEGERGVVLIIIALALVVLIGMMSIAIDGSYGFVQDRRAQNASDFAAFAAAQRLATSTFCSGTTALTTRQIVKIVKAVIQDNDASLGDAWTGQFLNQNGTAMPGATFRQGSTGLPPQGACGVNILATPSWPPFFAGIFGINQLGGSPKASVAPTAAVGKPIGIVALNKVGPHEILGGGTGHFVVAGDIVLNTDVSHQPWTRVGRRPDLGVSWEWDDAIDAKTGSNLYVYGTIHSNDSTSTASRCGRSTPASNPASLATAIPPPPSPAYQPR